MYNNREYQYKHVAGAATTVAFVGRGNLGGIEVNSATAVGIITVYDAPASNVASSTNVIAVIAAASPSRLFSRNLVVSSGLTVNTAGASDITIAYTQG